MASPYDNQYSDIRSQIYQVADKYGIPRQIALWQLWIESKFNPNVCSNKGACGIAQFTLQTGLQYNVYNRFDVTQSLEGYGKYMSHLLGTLKSVPNALAGYNAGEKNVIKYNGIPPFAETQKYVNDILSSAGITNTASNNISLIPSTSGGILSYIFPKDFLLEPVGMDDSTKFNKYKVDTVSKQNKIYIAIVLSLVVLGALYYESK